MSDHASPWDAEEALFQRAALAEDVTADVCVVGGGIAGLTTAYLMAHSGASVVVLEGGSLGGGETGRTSAHLASALDDRFHRLERLHGGHGALLAAQSHAAAIDFIEEFAQRHDIACGFQRVPGYLFAADPAGAAELADEEVAARKAGLDVTQVAEPLPWFRSGPCLAFARQAQFSPDRYLAGQVRELDRLGVRLCTRTRAEVIKGGRNAHVVTASGHHVHCQHIAVCTNVPVNDRLRLHTFLEAYRSYVIGVALPGRQQAPALLWDTGDPYHYVRLLATARQTTLIVGGEDHRTGQGPEHADEPYEKLDSWIRQRVPDCGEITHRWSGQIIEPVDGLALIGHNSFDAGNVHVIAGDSGHGLTHGTLGALILADQMRGLKNPWEELYRPSRFRMRSAGEYASHNLETLGQYRDWLRGADYASIDEVPAGGAGLVRHGLAKWAVHRDANGNVHACSAVCPHLGGLVRWNAEQGTWDCPCHGSRFSVTGAVLNGPANAPLARVDITASGAAGERLSWSS